ncbi:RHS repeat protein [Chryseobacterium sp. 09-1422]|uniref:RHS repeat protein n=1 Tax=Chryseobacterium kimseyorum TaxID=2984028 RepID=A0ABT3HVQ8_9FLAO|nr:RHS repeat domain-containing protein [Chryseobacterium kimseyorum]MCW3167872.1 RHS repeat protein [Chryseobacterium kimseyorum]
MKKILTLLITTGLLTFEISAQSQISTPPSAASFQNYANATVSPATGIPSISIPIYNLESSDAGFPISVALSYHPYSAVDGNPASEVGLGWTLFKGGSINRIAILDIDETKNITEITESEADIFYYSIPGYSGKFNIHKSSTGNDLVINNISGSKLKIEYTRDLNSTKLIINSFKITDDKGYQYFFNDYNIGTHSTNAGTKNHKTGFELNMVKDAGNHEIVNYVYDKKNKYIGASTTLKYQYCKLKDVITSKGKISFAFDYTASDDSEENFANDPYTVKNVSLMGMNGLLISKYEFIYGSVETNYTNSYGSLITKKTLAFLKKLNKNLQMEEQTYFEYRDTYNSPSEPGNQICATDGGAYNYIKGTLKKITFPTKGFVLYDFEANEVYADKSTLNFTGYNYIADSAVQYYAENIIPYNTSSSLVYTFQVQGNSGTQYPVYLNVESLYDGTIIDFNNPPPVFTFNVKNPNGIVMTREDNSTCSIPNYRLNPGTYTINTNNATDYGNFKVYQINSLPLPYSNKVLELTGARIKMIRSFDSDGTLVKTKKYDYNSFTNPQDATGYLYYSELNDPNSLSSSQFVLYKNVKETEISGNLNNGSIQYTYKIPDDYKDANLNPLYFNLTSNGLLEKKEIRNSSNQSQEKTEYTYTITNIPGASGHALSSFYSYIPGYVQHFTETNTVKRDNTNYITVNESTISPNNFQQISSKLTTHNGDIQETLTRYAQDLSDTRLMNANMISVPLESILKDNGDILSTSKTIFSNSGHFYPTSVVTTDLTQNPETQLTFDLYDDKGNLVQVTNKAGVSTTTIWGYNKTLPIAEIVGAKYSDISSLSVVTNAVTASDADADNGNNEPTLLTALNNLRLNSALQEYPITVYTYDPLVGVTNSISGNGIKVSYSYDAAGRLSTVKDGNGKLLKENQYNYKH